jgi:hypothetical protein
MKEYILVFENWDSDADRHVMYKKIIYAQDKEQAEQEAKNILKGYKYPGEAILGEIVSRVCK